MIYQGVISPSQLRMTGRRPILSLINQVLRMLNADPDSKRLSFHFYAAAVKHFISVPGAMPDTQQRNTAGYIPVIVYCKTHKHAIFAMNIGNFSFKFY
ncbi:hypothetical protein SDC9_126638 [bioreactor metagenome]|uniref:Uncharacterized protein n=1 Tax=bioreactor metagenome TaxID=1076179 RepID=A0A645CRS1_9ZZZZ